MASKRMPVRFTGQHFTIDRALIADAISVANLNKTDTILDIGAGKGFLTIQLVDKCGYIYAIENDKELVKILRKRLTRYPNVKLIECDYRDFKIPEETFKVVSNIPFGITSEILRSLMYENIEHFMGGSLVVQQEPALKLIAKNVQNPYIVFYKTFFNLEIIREIKPTSFMPPPTVRCVLLRIEKKEVLMSKGLREKYQNFIAHFLQKPHRPIRSALKTLFRKSQVRGVVTQHGINADITIEYLTADEWLGCFNAMLEKVPEKYHPKGNNSTRGKKRTD